MNQITEGLFCLADESSRTALRHYSYFLVHRAGNLLFHPLKKTSLLKRHEALFAEHDGVKLQVLTHDAEASSSCEWIHDRFGAGLYLVRVVAPDLGGKSYSLGNLVWSADGKMLYASALTAGEAARVPVSGLSAVKPTRSRCCKLSESIHFCGRRSNGSTALSPGKISGS